MALPRPPKPVGMTLNLAPMVDVMMCLIVFFLLASKMVAAEHHPVDLPWALAARRVDQAELGQRVTINVRRVADQDDVAEYVTADWDGQRVVDRVLQPAELAALLQTRQNRAAQEGRKVCCVIRADRQVMYRHVEEVLRACGLAKVGDIVFSVNEGREPENPQ